MSEIKTIPFKEEYLDLMEFEETQNLDSFVNLDKHAQVEILGKKGNGIVLIYQGRVLGVIGFYEIWENVCELWAAPTIYVADHYLSYARCVKKYADKVYSDFHFHRIQITALDDKRHNRWLCYLNFQCEGVLRQYSNKKETYKIWSRVK